MVGTFVKWGFLAVLASMLCLSATEAKDGKKGPPPKGPRADAEIVTVRGTVRDFTTAPKGEKDGVMLSDGTWVHWPPHLEDRFADAVRRGDKIKVVGRMETGPKGDTKLEVSTLTNLRTGETVTNPDRPEPGKPGADRPGDREERLRLLEAQVQQILREIQRMRNE
jgi:hypothetical protein